MVTHCFSRGPRKSSFVLRSKIQITIPKTKNDIPVTHHIIGVNGLTNAQVLEFNFRIGATTARVDAKYGIVKSTSLDRLEVISMSPTAASNFYMEEQN
jgi:hypothetical protein